MTDLDDAILSELQEAHLGPDVTESRSDVCLNLEREFRSPNHVRATVMNLQPPGFCILMALLDADDHQISLAQLKERVMEESMMLAARVTSGDLAAGDRDRTVYRKVLLEARRSDLELDASETKLLAVLRSALGIRTVEHFLIEHHEDFHGFWRTEHAFLDVMRTVRTRGLAFVVNSALRLPADLVAAVQQTLGVEGSAPSRRRLLQCISNDGLRGALDAVGLKLTGAKEERLQRLVDSYVQPREVLETLSLVDLKDFCRDAKISTGGTKDDLTDRLARHFASGADLRETEPPPPPPPPEERSLTPEIFDELFTSLRGEDLSDMLTGIDSSRVTGSKESKVALLKESRLSETSLLMHLDAKQLDGILAKRRLKTGGSKRERVERILADAATAQPQVPRVQAHELG